MKKFEKNSIILFGLLATLMMGGCSSNSSIRDFIENNETDDSNVECNTSIAESGIHFDITGVDYSAVTVINVDETNITLNGTRQLAAQCAQCHGTYGVAVGSTVENWPSLWGTGHSIARTMKDYNDTAYDYSAMHIHSTMTYTQEQIKLIQEYYLNITYTGGE